MNTAFIKFALLILSLSSISVAYPPMRSGEFQEIERLSRLVAEECPIEECLVIALGRSPTPIAAFLQGHKKADVVNLPLSDFKKTTLSREVETLLFEHFKIFIGKNALKDKTKVVVVDYCVSGEGLFAGSYYLNRYLQAIIPDLEVEAFGYLLREDELAVQGLFADNKLRVLTNIIKNNDFADSMYAHSYDSDSEFGSFEIEKKKLKKKKSSEAYLNLKNLLISFRDIEARPTLYLKNPNSDVRTVAFESVKKHKLIDLGVENDLLEALTDLDLSEHARYAAYKALEAIKPKDPKVINGLIHLLANHDRNVASRASEILLSIGPVLLEFSAPDRSDFIKELVDLLEHPLAGKEVLSIFKSVRFDRLAFLKRLLGLTNHQEAGTVHKTCLLLRSLDDYRIQNSVLENPRLLRDFSELLDSTEQEVCTTGAYLLLKINQVQKASWQNRLSDYYHSNCSPRLDRRSLFDNEELEELIKAIEINK